MEHPFERGVSGNGSYLDHEAATSISGGSSQTTKEKEDLLSLREISKDLAKYIRKYYPKIKIRKTVNKYYVFETNEVRKLIYQFNTNFRRKDR